MYSIVEFHDGVFAIPSIWLSADKKRSKWPPYDDKKIFKAISKKEESNENWESLSIINIFGTAPDYDSAIKKVSLAEQLTDINDAENAKRTRKSRARRIVSSDDSDNEKHSPQKKTKETREIATKVTESNIYPEFPTISGIIRSPLTNIKNNDNARLTTHDTDTTIVQRKKTSISFTKDILMSVDHTFLTTNKKLDYLIELQKFNIKKGNFILTKINDLQTRFNDLDKSRTMNKVDTNDEDDNIACLLPIEDIEKLNSFEEKLKNKEFYKQVTIYFSPSIHLQSKVTKLYNQGGKHIDGVVNRIMNLIFSNSLACDYSYFGKQKKKPFHNLVLCKCVLDAISHHHFDIKEDYTIKKIGYWLANAATRQA